MHNPAGAMIKVSGTRESGTPMTNPAAIAAATQPWWIVDGIDQVAATATTIATTPARTPRRALFGSFIQ